MIHRSSIRHIGRMVAGVTLSFCLLVGCAGQVKPTASVPSSSVTISKRLDDGQLRALYGDVVSVLCGNQLLYESQPSDSVSLISDAWTGETCYYLVASNQGVGTEVRTSTLYDKKGNVVCQFDCDSYVQLYNDRLVVYDTVNYTIEETEEQHYRIRSLSTGEEWACPPNTVNALLFPSGYLVLTVRDADCDSYAYDHTHVEVYDPDYMPVHSIDSSYCYGMYSSFSSCPADWVAIVPSNYEDNTTSLLNLVTGELLHNYVTLCGEDFVCVGTPAEGYSVLSLTTREVLAHYPYSCMYYNPDFAVLWNYNDYTNYFCNNDLPDALIPLKEYNLGRNGLILMGQDGTISAYQFATQKILYLPQDIHTESAYSIWAYDMTPEGNFLVNCYENFSLSEMRLYSMDGLVCKIGQELLGQYRDVYLIDSSMPQALLYGSYDGPAHSTLYNVFDTEGNVILNGLSSVYSFSNLPSNTFYVRKGFKEGWMDSSGEWLFCRSIFSTSDDTLNYSMY